MAGPWMDRIRRWFHAEPPASGSFDPATFERLCLENPGAAHSALMADQRELADELERTYAAYDARLNDVAARLASLSPQDIRREARLLRESQDAMRRTLRRIDASTKTARDLERELQEWESRVEDAGPMHADHPRIRAEIVRSELAARGGLSRFSVIDPAFSPFQLSVASTRTVEPFFEVNESPMEESASADQMPSVDPDELIGVIRMETREAERWHAIPDPDEEAIVQVRHVKMLHELLKRIDREKGMQRDRMALAVQMQEIDR